MQNNTHDQAHEKWYSNLKAGAQQLSIELSEEELEKLVNYLALLAKWNKVYNLTAVRSVDDMVGRHILDSLSVLPYLEQAQSQHDVNSSSGNPSENEFIYDVLDVGTGAGLPVIPLAIVRPDLKFLSVESNGKKTRFQQQAILELKLDNVTVHKARIEDVSAKANTVISRAFAAPEKFLAAITKNCTQHAFVIIMLGVKEKMPDELVESFSLITLNEIVVPQCESTRHIALCKMNA